MMSNSMQAVVGHWLFKDRKNEYSWHVEPHAIGNVTQTMSCEPFADVHHCPMLHPATHLSLIKQFALKEYRKAANEIIWSAWCALPLPRAELLATARCLETAKSIDCNWDWRETLKQYRDLLVTPLPYWRSAWHEWAVNQVGLDDCHRVSDMMNRMLPQGMNAVQKKVTACSRGVPDSGAGRLL
mmetsp:Transcript_22735/g.63469  ORF Transcript_22735/g.63469 Transcript_22735/m.63469 type:complete len:184 (-) Transcript_22735:118-669(-)